VYEQLKKNLASWVACSEEELELFVSIVQPQLKSYKRKELILREGEVCRSLFFIEKGCVRYYYTVEGEEKTGQFFFENGWYADLDSFLTQQPSGQNIQALEPSEILTISREKLYEVYDRVPIFERFGRLIIEKSYLGARAKNENLIHLSSEENYLKLIQERPKVIQRVPLHYIASYLGIKAESLSRIRKRIFEARLNS
jgi:CRP/FNR family transcriptional regulator, anaerobic regulatory protein